MGKRREEERKKENKQQTITHLQKSLNSFPLKPQLCLAKIVLKDVSFSDAFLSQGLIKTNKKIPIRIIYIYSCFFFIFNEKIKANLLKVVFT